MFEINNKEFVQTFYILHPGDVTKLSAIHYTDKYVIDLCSYSFALVVTSYTKNLCSLKHYLHFQMILKGTVWGTC